MTLITRSSIACGLAALLGLTPAVATAQQSGRSTSKSSPTPASLGIHGFSVVLVVGAMQGGPGPETDGVPDTAKKALTDMRGFLPYKRYQLLDAAWMLCCGSYKNGVSGRVRGPNDLEYTYFVDPISVSDAKLNVRFSMREMRDMVAQPVAQGRLSEQVRLEHSRQLYEAIRERDEAAVLARSTKQRFDVGLLAAPEKEAAELRHRRAVQRVEDLQHLAGGKFSGSSGQNVMDSTFAITPGETVVVGTSRLHGDQALIAILTAAAKPGVAR
jgi:hypothetical protein